MTTILRKIARAAIPLGAIAITFICTSIGGCYKQVLCKSYIKGVVWDWSTIKLDSYSNGTLEVDIIDRKAFYSVASTGTDKTYYEMICAFYGDTDYNQYESSMPGYDSNPDVILPNMTSISVTSDKDFDADHPAGTPLDDCIEAYVARIYDFIKAGYTREGNFGNYHQTDAVLLSELTADDLLLQPSYFTMKFTASPDDKSQTHKLTVTITDETATVHTASTDYSFE